MLKSVYIYGSYSKIKTGVSLFWTTRYICSTYRLRKTSNALKNVDLNGSKYIWVWKICDFRLKTGYIDRTIQIAHTADMKR